MKYLKKNWNSIVLLLLEIIAGILLLIDPVSFTAGIITVIGIGLMVIGLIDVIKYFRTDAEFAAVGQYMTKGLISLLGGAFCAFKSHWFLATFPVLTVIYGAVVLVTGLGKIQMTVDMARTKNKKWFLALISAAISIVCGIVILGNPFTSTGVLWMFTGITLIVEAVLDLITLIVGGKKPTQETAAKE